MQIVDVCQLVAVQRTFAILRNHVIQDRSGPDIVFSLCQTLRLGESLVDFIAQCRRTARLARVFFGLVILRYRLGNQA